MYFGVDSQAATLCPPFTARKIEKALMRGQLAHGTRVASSTRMKQIAAAAVILAGCLGLPARGQDATPIVTAAAGTSNVNERYVIESVEVVGVQRSELSRRLREDLDAMVGHRMDDTRVDRILTRLLREFPDYSVSRKVSRGDKPDHVKLVFELKLGGRRDRFDLAAPRALFVSRQGWTGEADATIRVNTSEFTAGVLSDGDRLLERYAGVIARYENRSLGTRRLRLEFDFESLHNVWNGATLRSLEGQSEVPGIYRTRQNFQPALTVVLARPLKLTVGTSFQRFQQQFPAAHTEAANAVIGTLRYDRLLESSGPNTHRLGAGYGLRAATRTLDSDYVYARHALDFYYSLWRRSHKLALKLTAGVMTGRAPLFERFVLGNSTTLRGWNKYDVAPLGGDRMVHNSLDYRYRALRVFYDTGAVWTHSQPVAVRHAAGIGLQLGDLALLLGFPVRSGSATPMFMIGMNL